MKDRITDVPGIRVGHAQDARSARGATVILCETSVSAAVEVRGGAPGTRETDCLNPVNSVQAPHAIYFGGGSAFGLAGATGVMKWLREKGIGFNAWGNIVPIVPGAVIFDLTVGDGLAYPDERMGYEACQNAGVEVAQGVVGAGMGAVVGWASDLDRRMKGGLGTASAAAGNLIVGALVVVNCWGDVIDQDSGEVVAGTLNETGDGFPGSLGLLASRQMKAGAGVTTNTTIGVIACNAKLTKPQMMRVAMMANDGYARAIVPSHTAMEGDTIFAVATGEVDADVNLVGALAAEAMARAIVKGVKESASAYGYLGHREVFERMRKKGR
ncbi:MAG: P1 family peptidase [Spirochaetota bacterium]